MAWGQWMVPEITAEADFRLKAQELELLSAVRKDPEAVARLAANLVRQAHAHEIILRKATHRIAELEAREAVGQRSMAKDQDYLRMARELKPVPWWVNVLWTISPLALIRRRPRR